MSKEGDLPRPRADWPPSAELLDVLADYPHLLAIHVQHMSEEEFMEVEDHIVDVLGSLSEEQWQFCLETFLDSGS